MFDNPNDISVLDKIVAIVEKERDDAIERVRLSIAEWYRLEKAAYGAPNLGGI